MAVFLIRGNSVTEREIKAVLMATTAALLLLVLRLSVVGRG